MEKLIQQLLYSTDHPENECKWWNGSYCCYPYKSYMEEYYNVKKKTQINIKFTDSDVDRAILEHLNKQPSITKYLRKIIMDDILWQKMAEDFKMDYMWDVQEGQWMEVEEDGQKD